MSLNDKVSILDLVNTTSDVIETVDNELSNIIYKQSNVLKVGTVNDNCGQIGPMTISNYATLPSSFNPGNKAWELGMKFKINALPNWNDGFPEYSRIISDDTDKQSMTVCLEKISNTTFSLRLFLTSSTNTWSIGAFPTSEINFVPGMNVWFRFIYDKTKYSMYTSIDGKNYIKQFDISNSNPIANSGKPLCLGIGSFNIFSYNGQPLDGEIDLNECYIDIDEERWWSGTTAVSSNELANIDLDNLSNNGKKLISNLSSISSTYDELTLGASGTTYTAPADGYVYISKDIAYNQVLKLFLLNENGNLILCKQHVQTVTNNAMFKTIVCPIKKGQKFQIFYDGDGQLWEFRFIYTEGNK